MEINHILVYKNLEDTIVRASFATWIEMAMFINGTFINPCPDLNKALYSFNVYPHKPFIPAY